MNKKQIRKFLTSLVFAIVLSLACINYVNAANVPDTITIKAVYNYTGSGKTKAHHRVTTTGLDAYCAELGDKGPKKGDVLRNPTVKESGMYVYILHDTDIAGNSGWPKSVLIRQHALWICQGKTDAKNYVYDTEAVKLCDAAKEAGDNYKIDPEIQSVTNPGKLEIGSGNYYESIPIAVKLKDITGNKYKIEFSGAPSGTKAYTVSGQEITGYTTASNFIIRVPISSVTTATTFNVKITANTSSHKRVAIYYPSAAKYQNMAVPYVENETPTTTVKATVEPSGITIKKVDSDTNKALAGAKYQVYSQAGCTGDPITSDTYTTNSNGTVGVPGLRPGTYYIKEVEPPAGYSVATNSCLSATTGGSVTFKNKKTFVKLYKQDQDHRNLPGATFGLYTNSTCTTRAVNATTGQVFDFANTDSNGTVTFVGMKAITGYYYLKEETPPDGYYVLPDSENCKPVPINGTVTFTNTRVASSELAIQKRDYYTKFGINGVRIGLYMDSNCSNKITEAITGSGQVKFRVEYTEGTVASLYAKELETPAGYIPQNGKGNYECKELKLGTTKNTAIIYNKPYGDIRLLKLDSETRKPIEGAEFTLLDENKNPAKDADGQEVQAKKTDEHGVLEFKNILYGTYFIKETASDGKHKIQTKLIKIVLNNKNDAVKLATNSSATYHLGDANGDSIINEDDLTVFQSIVNDPDLRFGLSPETLYALDINGDGNIQTSDIQKDMKILEYYLKIANSSNASVLEAARKYEQYKQELCGAVNDDECDTANVNTIISMYNNNSTVLANYQTAQNAANEQAAVQNAHAQEIYNSEMESYNISCPNGANTMDTDGVTPKAGCEAPPQKETFTPENVCPNYTNQIRGDANHDCKINDSDVTAFDGSNLDLNGDGTSNAKDKKILTDYIRYLNGSNSTSVVQILNNLATNQETLCEALGTDDCSINNSQLNDALSRVGKSGTLPSNVAKASLVITNKPIYVVISKQSISNSKEIPGAKIVIRDAKGNKILEFTSGKKAKKFKLGTGRYTLTEKVAPKGYKTLTTVITFEVLEDGTTKLIGAASSYYKIINKNHLIIYNELNDNIIIPDTGSNIAIISVVLGVVLVVGGGFLIYKKMV